MPSGRQDPAGMSRADNGERQRSGLNPLGNQVGHKGGGQAHSPFPTSGRQGQQLEAAISGQGILQPRQKALVRAAEIGLQDQCHGPERIFMVPLLPHYFNRIRVSKISSAVVIDLELAWNIR